MSAFDIVHYYSMFGNLFSSKRNHVTHAKAISSSFTRRKNITWQTHDQICS